MSLIFLVGKSKEITKSVTNVRASSNEGHYNVCSTQKTQELDTLRLKILIDYFNLSQ
jgi:hypothetical protein